MTDPLIPPALACRAEGPPLFVVIRQSGAIRETPRHHHARGQLLGAEHGLPMPQDARLLRIAQALSDRPDDSRRLESWAAWAGVSPRTLTRRFSAETGFSFTEWRQRVRLLRALELLATSQPVTTIALDLGYDNVSAFIALFRRVFGTTPGRYKV